MDENATGRYSQFGNYRQYLSFHTQRCETLTPFDGQLDRPRRSRPRHSHVHPQSLPVTTHRGTRGMPLVRERHLSGTDTNRDKFCLQCAPQTLEVDSFLAPEFGCSFVSSHVSWHWPHVPAVNAVLQPHPSVNPLHISLNPS